jgi:hypothetical protein
VHAFEGQVGRWLVSYQAHTPAEWAETVSLAIAAYGSLSIPYFLLVDADLADFDPRPAVHRALESGALDPLLNAVCNAKTDARTAAAKARHIPRDAAISLAALLLLLSAPAPEATR